MVLIGSVPPSRSENCPKLPKQRINRKNHVLRRALFLPATLLGHAWPLRRCWQRSTEPCDVAPWSSQSSTKMASHPTWQHSLLLKDVSLICAENAHKLEVLCPFCLCCGLHLLSLRSLPSDLDETCSFLTAKDTYVLTVHNSPLKQLCCAKCRWPPMEELLFSCVLFYLSRPLVGVFHLWLQHPIN